MTDEGDGMLNHGQMKGGGDGSGVQPGSVRVNSGYAIHIRKIQ